MKTLKHSLLLLSLFASLRNNAQVYVSTTGTDAPGFGTSVTNTYRTISYAVQQAAAGNTVFVLPGTYNETSYVYINKPLTLQKLGADAVIIDASVRAGATSNKYAIVAVNTHDVTIDGITVRNAIGKGWIGIWVLNDGSATATSEHITIKNCTVTNVGWISNNLTQKPPDSTYSTLPIKIQGGSAFGLKDVNLLNNKVYNCAPGWGEGIEITGNVDGFKVANNLVYEISNAGIDVAGNWASSGAPATVNRARNGVVENNTVHHCMSPLATAAGIYVDGGTGIRICNNRLYQNGAGISLGGEVTTTNYIGADTVYGNLIYNNSIGGIYLGTDTNNTTSVLQDTYVWNNTFYRNRTGEKINGVDSIDTFRLPDFADSFSGEIMLQNTKNLNIRNNIIYQLPGKIGITALWHYKTEGLTSNNNLFYRDDTRPLMQIGNGVVSFNGLSATAVGGDYYTLDLIRTKTGLEMLSDFENPNFAAGSWNMALTGSSPALNMGGPYNSALCGLKDFAGNNRLMGTAVDAGAYEYQGSVVVGTNTVAVQKEWLVYPIPACTNVTLLPPDDWGEVIITVTDMDGKQCIVQKHNALASTPITIQLSDLVTGTYILTLQHANSVQHKRLVVLAE